MTETHRRRLLAIDGSINLFLGFCLMLLPGQTIRVLGLPQAASGFYATVLGGVLFGIGIALWLERRNDDRQRGLGLAGALVINLFGAGVVLFWLLFAPPAMPFRGHLTLWVVVVVVLGTALAELIALASSGK